jgi:nucleoside phosphorylase
MTVVDRGWALRNLGPFAAGRTRRHAGAAARASLALAARGDQDIQRDLIDFDSEGPALPLFAARVPRSAASLESYVVPAWPTGLQPTPGSRPSGESLPKADVLIVTWTMDEGHALSRVLTPGYDSNTDWKPYRKNYARFAALMRAGCPARDAGRLGTYWAATIGGTRVTLFKSDSHMSQDGPKLPNQQVWEQIIRDCQPKWVITTGTGGGIGPTEQVGDVIVSSYVGFDCKRDFKKLNGEQFNCPQAPPKGKFTQAKSLFAANSQFLPSDNTRPPQITVSTSPQSGIVTTDFFGFDNTADTYGLQGKGDLSEMGDAVLGLACQQLPTPPNWVVVRNVSDPQINSAGSTLRQQTTLAADIYKGYGRWSSVCSAIVCWAIAAGLSPS